MKDKTRKKWIRSSLIGKRRRISLPEKQALDKSISNNVLSSDLYRDATVVLCYFAMPMEVDTSQILSDAWENGKSVALPRCKNKTHEMDFFLVRDESELEIGTYGIPEPVESCPLYVPNAGDLCIVPGLGFDNFGNRIGFGGGYYDRYLEKHDVTTAGLCYDAFLQPSLPTELFDRPVNYIFTQSKTIHI